MPEMLLTPSLPDVSSPTVVLPAVLSIGFTGHRKLNDEAACRQQILASLAEKKSVFAGTLCGVSSVASGADLLFVESCIALGIPLRVLLPLPEVTFRDDFNKTDWERAQYAMHQAISVEVVGNNEARTERYYECGLETVQRSQMLLALWNGKPAAGLGGTAEIIEFALKMGAPVLWIHSETIAVETRNVGEITKIICDDELTFLNGLPWIGTSARDNEARSLPEVWLAKLDANAVRVAPQVRRLAAVPIVCTALAAVFSGSAVHMPSPSIWLGAGAALGLVAALLPVALKLNRRQALWVRIRTAAEVTRSVLALWDTPGEYQIVGPEILPELHGMLSSLNLLKSQSTLVKKPDLSVFRRNYLESRVIDQTNYFSKQAARSGVRGRRYRWIGKLSIASAVMITLGMFVTGLLIKTRYSHFGGYWLPLLTSTLFQLATVAGALVVVHDCDRRQRRYADMHRSLKHWQLELEAYRTWHPVIQVANHVEQALLVELLEWRSLLQNRKMPRN